MVVLGVHVVPGFHLQCAGLVAVDDEHSRVLLSHAGRVYHVTSLRPERRAYCQGKLRVGHGYSFAWTLLECDRSAVSLRAVTVWCCREEVLSRISWGFPLVRLKPMSVRTVVGAVFPQVFTLHVVVTFVLGRWI